MTRDEYAEKLRQMTARELDAEVAEKVMEWGWMAQNGKRWFAPPEQVGNWGHCKPADMSEESEVPWWLDIREFTSGNPPHVSLIPLYSGDNNAAMDVAEKLQEEPREYYFELSRTVAIPPGHYHAFFGGTIGYADTAPRAICIAACLAVWQEEA